MAEKPMVLVVDDDDLHLLLLRKLLNNAGIDACCARNGEEALQELARHSFSCMITDFNMPRMNGLELARQAKQLAPSMMIALCTGEDFQDVTWLAIDEIIENLFAKPVNCSELLAMVVNKIRTSNQALSEEMRDEQAEASPKVCLQLSV